MIKMIALDLDNTLLNSAKEISSANMSILKKLHQSGVAVVLCTGRPINAVWPYVEQLGLTTPYDYTVTFNGGLVVHNTNQHILQRTALKLNDFSLIYEFAKSHNLPLSILDFKQVYNLTDLVPSTYQDILKGPLKFVDSTFADLSDQPYSKAIMSTDVSILDAARSSLPASIQHQYKIVRSQPQIMEFLPVNMSKAVGLKVLLQHFGLTAHNLMAFGDAENDLEMIQFAQVGVAMGNASNQIKKVATDITLDHNQDGVAVFLQKYFKL
jgi:Cof subfamily protein (haloacid dehalogenase superfamily)